MPLEDFDPEAMASEVRELREHNERMRSAWRDFIGKTRRGKDGCWLIPVDEMRDLGEAFLTPAERGE